MTLPASWLYSPTFDWKPSRAFPEIDGAYHWAAYDESWRRAAHGWAATPEACLAAIGESNNGW